MLLLYLFHVVDPEIAIVWEKIMINAFFSFYFGFSLKLVLNIVLKMYMLPKIISFFIVTFMETVKGLK